MSAEEQLDAKAAAWDECSVCGRGTPTFEKVLNGQYAGRPVCTRCFTGGDPDVEEIVARAANPPRETRTTTRTTEHVRGDDPRHRPGPSPSPRFTPTDEGDDDVPVVEWLLRAHQAGEVQPVDVALPPLPGSASPNMRAVAEYARLVFGLRLLTDDDRAAPLGCEWVARHTGMSKLTAWRTLKRLAACGVIERVHDQLPALPHDGQSKRPVHLYQPGNRKETA
jgi:hypothetical protein